MPPACFMSTCPASSLDRQVPQRPSRQENGSGSPALSAADRIVWSERHGTVWPDWLKLMENCRVAVPTAAIAAAAGAVSAGLPAIVIELRSDRPAGAEAVEALPPASSSPAPSRSRYQLQNLSTRPSVYGEYGPGS